MAHGRVSVLRRKYSSTFVAVLEYSRGRTRVLPSEYSSIPRGVLEYSYGSTLTTPFIAPLSPCSRKKKDRELFVQQREFFEKHRDFFDARQTKTMNQVVFALTYPSFPLPKAVQENWNFSRFFRARACAREEKFSLLLFFCFIHHHARARRRLLLMSERRTERGKMPAGKSKQAEAN